MGSGFSGGIKKKTASSTFSLPSVLPPLTVSLLLSPLTVLTYYQHSIPLQGFEPSHHWISEISSPS